MDFDRMIDLVFPPSADELLLRSATSLPIEPLCKNDITSLCRFSTPEVRAAIHLAKYHNQKRAKTLLSNALTNYLTANYHHSLILVPIPLSSARLSTRGYNQVTEVLKAALPLPNVSLETSLLKRIKDTAPQTSLKKTDRLENMQNAFATTSSKKSLNQIRGQHVILIDDVTTTGATLNAAAAALRPHQPASLTCLAFAH